MISFMIVVLTLLGLFFFVVAAVGVLRLVDFFTRSHAVGMTDTLGALLMLTALALYHGFSLTSVKVFFILILLYLANPTAIHAIMRAALRAGLKPWTAEQR